VSSGWGSVIAAAMLGLLLIGPVAVLLVLRLRGPVPPWKAFAGAILAELACVVALYLSIFALIAWQRLHQSDHGTVVVLMAWGTPWIWPRLREFGVLVLLACVIASVFLGGQWVAGRVFRRSG